jgi:arylsulfatase A-like enzyme
MGQQLNFKLHYSLFNIRYSLLLLPLLGGSISAEPNRPNIILFLVDDMGWMDCGAYGSEYFETPHMDAFAEESMRFTRAYAHPGCSPTRASILTGQTAARHGITTAWGHLPDRPKPSVPPGSRTFLELSQVTIAEALRDAGYRTGHFGKWHIGRNEEHWPEAQGFDVSWHCAPDAGPPSYFSPYGVRELYHLGKDIGETINVIESHRKIAHELEAVIDAHFVDADHVFETPTAKNRWKRP